MVPDATADDTFGEKFPDFDGHTGAIKSAEFVSETQNALYLRLFIWLYVQGQVKEEFSVRQAVCGCRILFFDLTVNAGIQENSPAQAVELNFLFLLGEQKIPSEKQEAGQQEAKEVGMLHIRKRS
jgi:hypothetical protein